MSTAIGRIKDIDYAYSVSRIHAVERSLLDRGKIMQIAEAKTVSDALRMIYDAGYKHEEDYEASFEAAVREAYELVYSMAPDPRIFDVFLIENDYYNLKVLLKAEFLDKNLDYLLNPSCRAGLDKIKEAVRERKGAEISDNFARAMDGALASFARDKNVQLVDMIIDKACFAERAQFAQETGNTFVIGLVQTQIDLINIRTMLRLRKMGKAYAFAKEAMLPGGSVSTDLLAMGVAEAKESVVQSFGLTKYGRLVADNAAAFDGGAEAMAALETACGDYLIDYMRSAKRVTFGVEPLVAYLFAKENEVKQLRIILVGKNSGMDSELLKRRLNIAYV